MALRTAQMPLWKPATIRSFSSSKETEGESVRNKEIEFYTNLNDWWGENCPQA